MPRLLVVLAAVCFGTTGTAQALGPEAASPASVGAARIVLGGALLAGVAATGAAARRRPGRPGPAEVPLVALGAAAVAAYQPAFFTGVQRTGVAVGTLVALGSAPVLTGVVEWLVLGHRPSRRWAGATTLAAVGVAVLVLGSAPGGARGDLPGVLAALGAGSAYAGYTIVSKRLLGRGWAPERVLGWLFGGAAVVLLPVLLATPTAWLGTAHGVATAAFLAVVPTAAAYLLFARGLRRLPAAETATLTLAEPATAAALALLLLSEPSTGGFWVGSGLLVTGLVLLAAPGRRRPGPGPAKAPRPPAAPSRLGPIGRPEEQAAGTAEDAR